MAAVRYIVQEGDEIQWNYTCDLGRDLGQAGWIKMGKITLVRIIR